MAFSLATFNYGRGVIGDTQLPTSTAPHYYSSTTDAIATIAAAGYFNSLQDIPVTLAPATAKVQLADTIFIKDSGNLVGWYKITAMTPNVTVAALVAAA